MQVHEYRPGADGQFSTPGRDAARIVEINATEYDGTFHWRHVATLVDRLSDGSVVTSTAAGLSVETTRGPWIDPWNTRGYYWPDRWYNVIRLEERDGRLNGFYCNAATPAVLDGSVLRYADLQLDIRAHNEGGDLRIEVLDEDEFEEARARYRYSDEVVAKARGAIKELRVLIEGRQYPFVI
jgi:protein associated with RNAse G/E